MITTDIPLTRVMALHALAYCERLFYLEEVEEIRVADANVYAGRRLHEELADDESVITADGVWFSKNWLRVSRSSQGQPRRRYLARCPFLNKKTRTRSVIQHWSRRRPRGAR